MRRDVYLNSLSIFLIITVVFGILNVIAQNVSSETLVEQEIGIIDNEVGETNDAEEIIENSETDTQEIIEESEIDNLEETSNPENQGADVEEFDIEDEEIEEELDAGLTPDSAFYFIDELFDRFGDCIDNRKEKVAEIKIMIEEGKIEEARQSLEKYEGCAEEVEREISPEEKEEVERSSKIIRKVIQNLGDKIPESDKEKFGRILDREKRIEKAAQIASKIKDLCDELSKLDPLEYSRVCNINDENAPEWRKQQHKKLTDEQKEEAKEFGSIMSECFRTSGRECRCEDIRIKPFADRCSLVAPLASKCDEGDENSCEAMNEATEGMEDLLPDYLLDIMFEIEEKYREDEFELHLPKECSEVGAKDVKKCTEVMFRRNAPGPCLNALDRGEISFENEREAREICEKIMFEENAPQECIDAGLKDHRECGKFMFEKNAPKECIDAGLTGGSPYDMRKCEEIMREFKEGEGFGPPDHAVAGGFRCKEITDSQERLKCYDEELSRAGERGKRYEEHYESRGPSGGWPEPCREKQALTRESCEKIMIEKGKERFRDTQQNQESFARDCKEKGGRWDCSFGDVSPGEPCRCFFDENRQFDDFKRGENQFKSRQEDERRFAEECSSRGGRWDCSDGRCNCYTENQPSSDFRPPEQNSFEQQPTQTEIQPSIPETESGTQQAQEGTSTGGGTGTEGTSDGTRDSSGSGGESSSGSGGGTDESSGGGNGGETSGVTGGVIFNNDFLDYYYK